MIDICVLCQAISQQRSGEPPSPATQQQPSSPATQSRPGDAGAFKQGLNQSQNPQRHSVDRFDSKGPDEDSLQGTPSTESFTQGHLGDDERSSESEISSQERPPRTTSLYLRQDLLDADVDALNQAGGIPLFASPLTSPKGINTPQSTASSNKTPTQTRFPDNTDSTPGPSFHLPHVAPNAQKIRHSPQTSTDFSTRDYDAPTKQSSGDSSNTVRATKETADTHLSAPKADSPRSPQSDADRLSRAPARMSALRESEIPLSKSTRSARIDRSRSRSVSRPRHSLSVPGTYNDEQFEHVLPSNNPTYGTYDHPQLPSRSPEPGSPGAPLKKHRGAPIHYGIDHDFVPESSQERKSRSRSYSRASTDTHLSQDSKGNRERIFQGAPAHGTGDGVPSQFHSGQIPREASRSPRRQAPEYQIEGTGPALEWPSDTKPRSRRGSRSSAFFKSITSGSSSRADDEPPLPNKSDKQDGKPLLVNDTPVAAENKRRSLRLLRPKSVASGNGDGSIQYQEGPASGSRSEQRAQPLMTRKPESPTVEDDEFPSRGDSKSAASRLSRRLQKGTPPDTFTQEGGKKKRFSGLGVSLFFSGFQGSSA